MVPASAKLRCVELLTIDDLRRSVDRWDAAVDVTPGIDRWCTSSLWAVPVFDTWGREPSLVLHDSGPRGECWAAFGSADLPEGRALIGLDGVWGFRSEERRVGKECW